MTDRDRRSPLSRRPRISLTSWGTAYACLLREISRNLLFAVRLLLFLPVHGTWKRRTENLLGREAEPSDDVRAGCNDEARARFRRTLGAVEPRRVFVSCGEHSGEGHARAFVRELRKRSPDVEVAGFGGRALASDGVRLLENLVDRALLGFREVAGQLPFYVRVAGLFLDELKRSRPDVVVLIDSPGINMVLAGIAKRRGVPVLYYVCPQYWAWAPWRLGRFRRSVDGAISILPFERPMFEARGVPIGFAGNPLLTRVPELAPEPRPPLLALLPGSRRSEIERHLPPMLALLDRFRRRFPEVRAVIPQQNPRHMDRIRAVVAAGTGRDEVELHEGGVFDVLARVRLALVKSGTSTLQTALCRTPQVVVFRLAGRVEKWLTRYITSPWIAAPNLVLGRGEVPEFLFCDDRVWDEAFDRLVELWPDGDARRRQLDAMDEVRRRVGGTGATAEAVRWILPDRDPSGPDHESGAGRPGQRGR